MTGPSADVFFRNYLPYTTGTSYGFYGSGLSTSNFNFTNEIRSPGVQGNIELINIPSGRYRVSYQIFRSSTSAVSTLTVAIVSRSNLYFNWSTPADMDYMFDDTANSLYDPPTGPGTLYSTTTYGNFMFDAYFTSLGSGNLELSFYRDTDYATNTGTEQNALFTLVKVGPSAVSGSMTDNFVDDEIAGGPPPG